LLLYWICSSVGARLVLVTAAHVARTAGAALAHTPHGAHLLQLLLPQPRRQLRVSVHRGSLHNSN
jgi:hypothetical protein